MAGMLHLSPTSDAGSNTYASDDESAGPNSPENYRLYITAGPSYDKSLQRPLAVNTEHSLDVSDEVSVTFRIAGFHGLDTASPRTSAYFDRPDHKTDTFSIAFSITPKADISTENLWFGVDTGHNPIRKYGLPKSLVKTALNILTGFVDPSLHSDVVADGPWIMGPVLCGSTMQFRINGHVDDTQDTPGNKARRAPGENMSEGALGSGQQVRQASGMPDAADKRRKWFLDDKHRQSFVLERGRTYDFDFSNGYIDPDRYRLRLPGFSIGVLKYIGTKSHKFRWVLKDVKTDKVYFVIMCTLLTGDELEAARHAGSSYTGAQSPVMSHDAAMSDSHGQIQR